MSACLLVLLQCAILPIGMFALGFHYDGTGLNLLVGCVLAMAAISQAMHRIGRETLARLSECYFILFASALLVSLNSIVFAATNFPYVDTKLIAADYVIFGISWIEIANAAAQWPLLSNLLSVTYSSLAWQPFLLLGILAIVPRGDQGQRFTFAWVLAMSLSLLVFPFAPAVGGYLHHGFVAEAYPHIRVSAAWDFAPVLEGARDGTLRTLGATPVIGMVTFPSFHAAAAVILGWHWRLVPGATFFVPLNILMLCSTVPVGGHYIVDVMAGCVVAAVAIAASKLLPPRHSEAQPLFRQALHPI